MKRYLAFTLAIVLALGVAFAGCSAPAPQEPSPTPSPTPTPTPSEPKQTIEISFGHHNPPQSWTTKVYLDPWMKLVEEKTGGQVEFVAYPSQSLFKMAEAMEAISGGVADMGWAGTHHFQGKLGLSLVTTLPFMNVPSPVEIDGKVWSAAAINSRITQELYDTIPEIQAEWDGVKLLFMHTTDPAFLASNKPVKTRADLNGLKIREVGGYPAQMWELLGASPIAKPMPEVYETAEKGVIDAAGLNWAAVSSYKLYEVFDYYTPTSTVCSSFFVAMNQDKWDSLPADVQDAIMSVSGVWGAMFAAQETYGPALEEAAFAEMEKEGKVMERIQPAPGEIASWKETVAGPVWDNWVQSMEEKGLPGQQVFDACKGLVDKYSQMTVE